MARHRKPWFPSIKMVFLLLATGVLLVVSISFGAATQQTVVVAQTGDQAQRAVNVASAAAEKAGVLAGALTVLCDRGQLSTARTEDGRPLCVVAVETKTSPVVLDPRAAAAVPAPTTITEQAPPAPVLPPVTITEQAPPTGVPAPPVTVTQTAPPPPPATVTATQPAEPPITVTATEQGPPPETVTQTETAPPAQTVTETATPPPDTVTQTETAPPDSGQGDGQTGDTGGGNGGTGSGDITPLPTMTEDPQPQQPGGELNIPNPLGVLGGGSSGGAADTGGANTTHRGNRHH